MRKVAMFGLGFVGLPLGLSFSMRGCKVTGVDIDTALVNDLNNGITHHLEGYSGKPIQEILREQSEAGRFVATTDAAQAMKESDSIIITVGIPVEDHSHDMSALQAVCEEVGKGLKKGDLLLIRGTMIPGSTRDFIKPILEHESGFTAGVDFYLAYSSERIAEGKAFDEFENMPAALGGINEESGKHALELMSVVTKAPIMLASCMEVVEASKVMENVSRDVDIAMVNEFARFAKAMDLDVFELVKVANTHKRVKLLSPGPGVGGYCLPNAVFYLLPKAEEIGVSLDLLKLARKENEEMPRYVADLILRNLDVAPKDAKIAVFGFAMKDFSNDDRCSPPVAAIRALQASGCTVCAYDPAVPVDYDFKCDSIEKTLEGAHALAILTQQRGMNYKNYTLFSTLMTGRVIFDARSILDRAEVTAAGFKLETL